MSYAQHSGILGRVEVVVVALPLLQQSTSNGAEGQEAVASSHVPVSHVTHEIYGM